MRVNAFRFTRGSAYPGRVCHGAPEMAHPRCANTGGTCRDHLVGRGLAVEHDTTALDDGNTGTARSLDYWAAQELEMLQRRHSSQWSEILPLDPGGHQVYRLYGATFRDLLYVGVSWSALVRASQHRDSKQWWREITRIVVQNFPSRADAEQAERLAIITEAPLYNRQHNTPTSQERSDARWHRARLLSPILDDHLQWLSDVSRELAWDLGRGAVCGTALWYGWGRSRRLAPDGGFRTSPHKAAGWHADVTGLHPADADFLMRSATYDTVLARFQQYLPDCAPMLCEINCHGVQPPQEDY